MNSNYVKHLLPSKFFNLFFMFAYLFLCAILQFSHFNFLMYWDLTLNLILGIFKKLPMIIILCLNILFGVHPFKIFFHSFHVFCPRCTITAWLTNKSFIYMYAIWFLPYVYIVGGFNQLNEYIHHLISLSFFSGSNI